MDLWDGITGVRGRVPLGRSNWSLPYSLDFGTGSLKFTWQGMAGITYGFSWAGVQLVYRHLSCDQKDDKLLQSMRSAARRWGVLFRF